MEAKLIVSRPGEPEKTHSVTGPVTIGRDGGNEVQLDIHFVSRTHLQLQVHEDGYRAADLGSTNGTWLNGEKMTPNQPHPLHSGDILRIGDNDGNTVGITLLANQATGQPAQVTRYIGEVDLSSSQAIVIGRDPASSLFLDHPGVSRRHAEVRNGVLHDLGSANGTFVNGQRLSSGHPLTEGDSVLVGPFKLVYQSGRLIEFSPEGNYRIDAFGLDRTVKVGGEDLTILNDISLSIYPKEFVAVVGGSGAGKSTFLKALNGFAPANAGTVLVNGEDLYDNFGAYRANIGYVPQDDIIHQNLTVEEALTYAARLRLPDAEPEEIEARMAKVLDQVEMTDHRKKLVKNLSGGQRKRVSISAELLADPGLFFLDEPTSGLDPGLEKKMMQTLRRLADGGRTIMLITHATDNIGQCTHVVFLARGRLCYYGPPKEALDFFGAHDFADIYTRLSLPPQQIAWPADKAAMAQSLIQQGHPTDYIWQELYKTSPQYAEYVTQRLSDRDQQPTSHASIDQSGGNVSFVDQFRVLTGRYFNLIRRDRLSLIILLAVMPVIGLLLLMMTDANDLVGLSVETITQRIQSNIEIKLENDLEPPVQSIYQIANNTERFVFIMALAAALLGLFAAAYEIVKEGAIYQRERLVNLRIGSYLSSKVVLLGFFALIQCALLLLVLRFKIAFPETGVILPSGLEMYITLLLGTLASICLGLLISAIVRNSATVIYAMLVVVFVQIMFAGVIFPLPNRAEPISYLTTMRWTIEGLGDTIDVPRIIDLGGGCLEMETPALANIFESESVYCTEQQLAIEAEYSPNLSYSATPGHLLSRWAILILYSAVLLGATAFVQKRKDVI